MLPADELYLIAHDDRGRPRTHDRAVDLGLATALLGELVLDGPVTVHNGRLGILDGPPPDDALAHTVLEQLTAQRQCRQVRIWLALLAGWSFDAVGERLERQGLVTRTKKRWGRTTRYVPVDVDLAAVPANRLRRRLACDMPVAVADGLLFGLVSHTGLAGVVLRDAPASSHPATTVVMDALPLPLRELVACLGAAVPAATSEHRAVMTLAR